MLIIVIIGRIIIFAIIKIIEQIQFPNSVCQSSTTGRNGTCYTSSECTAKGWISMMALTRNIYISIVTMITDTLHQSAVLWWWLWQEISNFVKMSTTTIYGSHTTNLPPQKKSSALTLLTLVSMSHQCMWCIWASAFELSYCWWTREWAMLRGNYACIYWSCSTQKKGKGCGHQHTLKNITI